MRRMLLMMPVVLGLLVSGCSSGSAGADKKADQRAGQQTAPAQAARWWHPKPRTTWQWQLSGRVDTSVRAAVYDVDLFETPKATVTRLHQAGRKVICYTAIGSAETWRPDFRKFPKRILGKKVQGWENERWVDIRALNAIRPIWAARLDMCKRKGFDAVEPDWMDGYKHDTGFPLKAAHQLAFNRMLARMAHARGLAIGLKNDLDQIPKLVGIMDFAVNEQCAEFSECGRLTPFIRAGKAVFHAEYNLPLSRFCPQSRRLGLSSIRKHIDLPAARQAC